MLADSESVREMSEAGIIANCQPRWMVYDLSLIHISTWDPRFWKSETPKGIELPDYGFTSNWSERHIAFVCGLGTFGLSRGLITKAGIAGRFASLVTDLEFEPVLREYDGLYDYCTNCGACIRRCPVNAISFEKGKAHEPCASFLDYTCLLYTSPR